MKKRLTILTKDRFLYQKIYLALRREYVVSDFGDEELSVNDIVIADVDSVYLKELPESVTTVGFSGADLIRPFSERELREAISDKSPRETLISLGERAVYLRGERIKLTDVEFSLISRLLSAGGEFVSRDELLRDVWGDGFDGGVLNVYIHYLREKLETGGEKIIISSRKNGYKIDEKYLREEGEVC